MGSANVAVTSYVTDAASPPACVIVPSGRSAELTVVSSDKYTRSTQSPDARALPTFFAVQPTSIVSADTAVDGAVRLTTVRSGWISASGASPVLLSSRDCSKTWFSASVTTTMR